MRLALVAFLVSCATSRAPAVPCDPLVEICVDAGIDAPPVDAGPKQGFGESCTDSAQCESNLCILVGSGGSCTQLCGTCPDGWGCVGVIGIEFENQISLVCVPEATQLCTTCAQDTECALIGMDKCVTFPDGDKYCSQDCSTIGCPVGYGCETVDVAGTDFKQCIPSSGACDCTAANPGAEQPCNITTPFNVCAGAQTCSGAAGWGACEPPSTTDDPDAAFADSNCDGIDGDIAKAIFVSGAGANTATCGLTFSDPCQTIPFAISRAQATARPHVYVQAGTYAGGLAMANGISIFGGYNINWQRASHTVAGHAVTISGGNPAVSFTNITMPTTLDNVIVLGANAIASSGSAIGVLVTASQQITLRGLTVDPGAGVAGVDGANGGLGAIGGDGGPGTPGCEDSGTGCSGCPEPAIGKAGTSSCSRPGGGGGRPGHPRANSGFGFIGGTGSVGMTGGPGAQCSGSRACDGTAGTTGTGGATGVNGSGGAAFGGFSTATYVVSNGANGQLGFAGNGGGGGGGGGGGDDLCDSYGSSGGGGGGGGCGGAAGQRGIGGGGSFGVITHNSMVIIDTTTVTGRAGGRGGNGGTGGSGGAGGSGGSGGAYGGGGEQDDGGDGARGGNGGRGGDGGRGGGGGGGPSIAVVCLGTSTVSALASTLAGGTGGAGGSGGNAGQPGTSAPTFGCPF